MPYVPGFQNDVFISYCHGDEPSLGRQQGGWVSDFHAGLESRLRQILGSRDVGVWRDERRLSGEFLLDDAIRRELEAAAVFLAIVTPLYLSSPYCTQEREWFLDHMGDSPITGNLTRAIRVVKTPHKGEAHRRVFDRGLGFEFFQQSEIGFQEYSVASKEFADLMENLCQGVARVLESMRRERSPVYVACCAKPVRGDREKLVSELSDQGYRVLPEIEIDSENVEAVTKQGVDEAGLSVHLFGAETHDLSIRQAEIAMDLRQPLVAWALEADLVRRQDQYGEFLRRLMAYQDPERRSHFLDRTRLERVKTEVLTLLEPHEAPPPIDEPKVRRVYIVCDSRVPEDYRSAWKIKNLIAENDNFVVDLPETAPLDPGELRADHNRKLRDSHGLLVYWGKSSPGWFEATKDDLDRKEYLSEAVAVTNGGASGLDGRVVLRLDAGFPYEALDPFLQPLRA
jgi:hypothetical protein